MRFTIYHLRFTIPPRNQQSGGDFNKFSRKNQEKRGFFRKKGGDNGFFCNRVTDIVTDGENWLCDKKVEAGSSTVRCPAE